MNTAKNKVASEKRAMCWNPNCSHFCGTLGESVSAQSQLVAAVATDPIHSIYFTFITNWQNCRCRDYLHPNFPFCPVFRKSMTHHKTDKIFSFFQVFIWNWLLWLHPLYGTVLPEEWLLYLGLVHYHYHCNFSHLHYHQHYHICDHNHNWKYHDFRDFSQEWVLKCLLKWTACDDT